MLISILLASMLAGCARFDEPPKIDESENATATASPQTRAGATPVFETMENPYSLARMRRLTGNNNLQPTHIYGRFLPQDSTQLNRLENTLNLDLFDYPLDVNIEDDEMWVDPAIPAGQFTWQYTVVPANFVFPTGITWNKLYDCYIPADYEEVPLATRAGEPNLERAAILDCGYTIPPATRASGRPAGQVTVLDDSVTPGRYVPVKGVRVKCHYFLKVGKDYTDENGNYSINKTFHVKPHYTVVFKNEKDFIIWDQIGIAARAKYHVPGRQSPSGYNIRIEPDLTGHVTPNGGIVYDRGWQEAAVNNAAYDYYRMCETTGIAKPPKNLKILVHPSMGNSAPMIRRMSAFQALTKANWATFLAAGTDNTIPVTIIDGIFKFLEPDVTIADDTGYKSLYETTSHELSHASHFSQVGAEYWARYISHIIRHNGTGPNSGPDKGVCEVGEMWGHAMGHIQECELFSLERKMQQYAVTVPQNFNRPGDNDWIHPDPIWALITRGVLSKRQVFDCLTSDVDTVDKLINKLCVGKTTAVANMIRTAFAHNDVPVITGTATASLNTNLAYSVPDDDNMAENFTAFNGWTVNPDTGGATINNRNNPNTTIRFNAAGTYTLSANYTLSGNTYSATKTVTAVAPLVSPQISGNKYVVYPGEILTCTVNNPNPQARYDWELDGMSNWARDWGPNQPLQIMHYYLNSNSGMSTIRCRARIGNEVSGWSNTLTVYVSDVPLYRAPAPQTDDEEEETEESEEAIKTI